jgi:hypothetical protein
MIYFGVVNKLGRKGESFSVRLETGKTIQATSVTNITQSSVIAYQSGDRWYCLGNESRQIKTKVTKIYRSNPENRQELETLFLCIDITRSITTNGVQKAIDYLSTISNKVLVNYLVFGDTIYFPDPKFRKKNIILNELNTGKLSFNDTYTPNTFWHDEGGDIPENGIDVIFTAIVQSNLKAIKKVYLVTDNDKYSNNFIDPVSIGIDKIKKLYIDIIPPSINIYEVANPSNLDFEVYNASSNYKSVYAVKDNGDIVLFTGFFINPISYFPATTEFKTIVTYQWKLVKPSTGEVVSGQDYTNSDTLEITEQFNTGTGNWDYLVVKNGVLIASVSSAERLEIIEQEYLNATLIRKINNGAEFSALIDSPFKVVYSPQSAPSIFPDSGFYTDVLPPSGKIIYL